MSSESMNRRGFLKASAQVAAGVAVARSASGPAYGVVGANERIRIACVGVRGRGRSHISGFLKLRDKGVDVTALCDVDEQMLNTRATDTGKQRGKMPATYRDIRKLLDDPSIDAISIATPNHWHALMTVWACQAKKDVYVEKPASWCVREGRKMVEAARKHDRIVQVGTQARSFLHVQQAMRRMHAGLIGNIYMARALCYKRRESIGVKPTGPPPKHVDFDLWLGPAPKQDYHANLVHYNWHWFWDFGNGDLGNQGVHEMDLARVALNKDSLIQVSSTGGRYGYRDQGQTPNTQVANLTYADGTVIAFEVRGRFVNAEHGVQLGNLFYGSQGYLAGANWGSASPNRPQQSQAEADWRPKFGFGGTPYGDASAARGSRQQNTGDGADIPLEEDDLEHYANFIAAMRSRKREDLTAEIIEGHRSAMLVHIANIAYRLRRTLTFDPKKETFIGDGAREANAYLTREYREPFVVPEQV